MGKDRLIVNMLLGYIIGILWGLYLNISIVFLYLIIFLIIKIISFTRIFKYVKLLIKPATIVLLITSSLISNLIFINQNRKYENLYKNVNEVELIAKVIDNGVQKEYSNRYKIKVINGKYKNTYLYLNSKSKLEYGDLLHIKGSFKEPEKARNYKGFDYKEYLKTEKIYGTINEDSVKIIERNTNSKINTLFNNIFLEIKDGIEYNFDKDTSSILLGILLGYTEEIDEEVKQNFSESNISHILAVSGMHISYLIIRSNIYYR